MISYRPKLAVAWVLGVGLLLFGFDRSPLRAAEPKPLKPAPLYALSMTFSPDSKSLAVAAGNLEWPGEMVVWDIASRQPRFVHHEAVPVPSVAYAPDGSQMATGARYQTGGKLVDPLTGDVRGVIGEPGYFVRCVAFSPDGKLFASGSYHDYSIRLWDLATWQVKHVFTGHERLMRSLAISPDGRWLATAGGEENTARWWDLREPTRHGRKIELENFSGHVSFSPDSQRLVISNWSNKLLVIDPASGETVDEYQGLSSNGAVFSPDGKWLAAASPTRDLYVFSLPRKPSDDERGRIEKLIANLANGDSEVSDAAEVELLEYGGAAIEQLKAAANTQIVSMANRAWRVIDRLQHANAALKVGTDDAGWECVAFSPDGRLLAGSNAHGLVRLWSVPDWEVVTTLAENGTLGE